MEILIIFISIVLSAFFSGMEIAFVSANKFQMEIEKNENTRTSKILTKLTQNPSKFITTMLVGNNIALVVYGYFMGELLVRFLQPYINNSFILLLTQTFISTIIILVTAEFLPKAIFRIYANQFLKNFSKIAYFFYILFYYVSDFITKISNIILKLIFKESTVEEQQEFSKKELGYFISEQLETNDNNVVDSEIQLFQNALEFHDVKAREVMIPRTEIVAIDVHESIKKLKKMFVDSGLSKIIVYKNSLDDIIGYVNAFELFKNPKSIRSILLPIEFVPETMLIKNILEILSKKRKSIAIVIDEYGGTSGMITKEDIIEELFGEIIDEHDKIETIEEKINNREYRFSARLEIDYVNENYNLDLPKEDSYETIGGLIVNHTESIPQINEIITIANFEFTITSATKTKIEEVKLKILDLEA
ncbi:MAG TPA: HlyC/CorC family transporter [Flavobacteriia bacterium]|nr:HlyC/CorC family transporter [Flavobacteriia bacterium]